MFSSGIPSWERTVLGSATGPSLSPGMVSVVEKDMPVSSAGFGSTVVKCYAATALQDPKSRLIYVGPNSVVDYVASLPQRSVSTESTTKDDPVKSLKIAFRYQHLQEQHGAAPRRHYLDVGSRLGEPLARKLVDEGKAQGVSSLAKVLELLSTPLTAQNTLIILDDFLGPLWRDDNPLPQLSRLRHLLTPSNAAVLIGLSSRGVLPVPRQLVLSVSDWWVQVVNALLSDNHAPDVEGFVNVVVPTAANLVGFRRLVPSIRAVKFVCRARRQFEFDPYHLPPELSSLSTACSSKVDF